MQAVEGLLPFYATSEICVEAECSRRETPATQDSTAIVLNAPEPTTPQSLFMVRIPLTGCPFKHDSTIVT